MSSKMTPERAPPSNYRREPRSNRGIERGQLKFNQTGPIEWRQADRWHLVSDCGYYTVAKATVRNAPSYGAWFRPDANGYTIPMHLGEYPTADEAKVTADAHKQLQIMKG